MSLKEYEFEKKLCGGSRAQKLSEFRQPNRVSTVTGNTLPT